MTACPAYIIYKVCMHFYPRLMSTSCTTLTVNVVPFMLMNFWGHDVYPGLDDKQEGRRVM